ncbi:hypothetical protein PMAYCL1PPCAC_16703, partial [Pristionchus mayeri]
YSSSPSPSMDSSVCLICAVPINSLHLGIEACRACACFYTRTVKAGRKFACRQGDRKCVIRKHQNYMCRRYRYDKCVEFGMIYEPRAKRRPKNKEKAILELLQSLPLVERNEEASLIDRMEAEYRSMYARRLVQEKEYVTQRKLTRYNHPTQELYLSDFPAFYELFRIAIKESNAILQNVFEEFTNFPIEHRVTLFKNFLAKFNMMEGIYLSTKYFKNSTMVMASLITCGDMSDQEEWMKKRNKNR